MRNKYACGYTDLLDLQGLFDPAYYRVIVEGIEVKYGGSGSFEESDTSAIIIGEDAGEAASPMCFRTEDALTTTYAGGKWAYGAVFSIQARQSLAITSLALNTDLTGNVPVIVLVRNGLFAKDEKGLKVGWSVLSIQSVQGRGIGNPTILNCFEKPLVLHENETLSFYVSILKSEGTPLAYTEGSEEGAIFSENSDIIFSEGIGLGTYPFSAVYSNRGKVIQCQCFYFLWSFDKISPTFPQSSMGIFITRNMLICIYSWGKANAKMIKIATLTTCPLVEMICQMTIVAGYALKHLGQNPPL